jgi:hypothetical protein
LQLRAKTVPLPFQNQALKRPMLRARNDENDEPGSCQ